MQVVLCSSNLTDLNKVYCWSEPRTARSNCSGADPTSCHFSYNTSATPAITGVTPRSGQGGAVITVSGLNLVNISQVWMDGRTWGAGSQHAPTG